MASARGSGTRSTSATQPAKFQVASGSLNRQFAGWRLYANLARYLVSRTGPISHAAQELMAM